MNPAQIAMLILAFLGVATIDAAILTVIWTEPNTAFSLKLFFTGSIHMVLGLLGFALALDL